MTDEVDWVRVAQLIDDLYTASNELECIFPGRKFTLDGHLVGSVGEVIAAFMFDLTLNRASTRGHDAASRDGRSVEIKLTQGNSVAIRHEPEHLIVLHRPKGGPVRVVFNGPGLKAWVAAGKMQANGQRQISLTRLARIAEGVPVSDRLPLMRQPPV